MSEFIILNPTKDHNNINHFAENTLANLQNKNEKKLGEYYKQGDIEVIDFVDAYKLNFNLGNAVKYIARCNYKKIKCPKCDAETSTKVNDLRKAIWYIEREIEKCNVNQ